MRMKNIDRATQLPGNKVAVYAPAILIIILTAIQFSCLMQPCPSLNKTGVHALKQPDPIYYNNRRDELLTNPGDNTKTYPIPWMVICAKEGAPVYENSLSGQVIFNAEFCLRFQVLQKQNNRLRVKELDTLKRCPRTGWISINDLIYLPRALRDTQTGEYMKVLFIHRKEKIEPQEIGKIVFYSSPNFPKTGQKILEKEINTTWFAYVYAWENTSFEDSQYVLLGNSPAIPGILTGKKAGKEIIYGWCKTSAVFPLNSRAAIIPNPDAQYPSYIFRNNPDTVEFYKSPDRYSVPESVKLLTDNTLQMCQDSKWPLFPISHIAGKNRQYLELICLAAPCCANMTGISRDKLYVELLRLEMYGKNLDVVFLADATTGMKPYLEAVANGMNDFMLRLQKNTNFLSKTIRFGAAVYRDYVDGPQVFENVPLSSDTGNIIKEMNQWAGKVSVNKNDTGNAQWPEALFNGMVQSVTQAGYGQYHTKFLIIIGDTGNHSRDKDMYTRYGVGKLLADHNINCLMVKINHPITGGKEERDAMKLFKIDASGIRSSFILAHFQNASGYNFVYPVEETAEWFFIDEVNTADELRRRLADQYAGKITDCTIFLIKLYRELYGKISNAPAPFPSKDGMYINPHIFEDLNKKSPNSIQILEELKKQKAYVIEKGYACEADPRTPGIHQFKNVYLYRKSELSGIIQVLAKTLDRLATRKIRHLWEEMAEVVYGETYENDKSFNYYLAMYDDFTFKSLDILFGKTQDQINLIRFQDFDPIEQQILAKKGILEKLIDENPGQRFFGPGDDPFIWLNEDEIP